MSGLQAWLLAGLRIGISMEWPQLRFPSKWGPPIQLTEDILPFILLSVLVESFLYGIHAVLFSICVYILVQRRRKQGVVMLTAIVIMFMLATADIGISWNITLRHTTSLYTGNSNELLNRIYPKFLLYIINNLIADVLLVLRCYVVWDRKKVILIPASIVLVIGTVFGFIGEGTVTLSVSLTKYIAVYIFIVVFFNFVLALLTAGRIFWIAREVKSVMGREMSSQYHFAMAIVIESGLIYDIANILVLSLSKTRLILMAAVIAIRIVCIMPILIVVQIALGHSTNMKDARIRAAAHQAGSRTPVILDTIVSSDRYESGADVIESARDDLGVSCANESVEKDIILERRTGET